MSTIKRNDYVGISGYLGCAIVTDVEADGTIEVYAELDGKDFTWHVSHRQAVLIDDFHPVPGTTWLDPITGIVYRLRGWSMSWTKDGEWEPSIALQYPGGAMGTDRDLALEDLHGFQIIYTPATLTRA